MFKVITAFFTQTEESFDYAKTVFDEMVVRNIPAQLLKITIDNIEIIEEFSGRRYESV